MSLAFWSGFKNGFKFFGFVHMNQDTIQVSLKFNLSNWMFIIFEFDPKLFYTIDVLFVFPKDEPNS